jgi:hypothetical protein
MFKCGAAADAQRRPGSAGEAEKGRALRYLPTSNFIISEHRRPMPRALWPAGECRVFNMHAAGGAEMMFYRSPDGAGEAENVQYPARRSSA